jgi:tRNA pseudouridine38-40 synthase
MKKGARFLEGKHDFRGFMNVGSEPKEGTERRLMRVRIKKQRGRIVMAFLGEGFLYNQVRIMAGTLLEVGLEKRFPESLEEVLDSRNRKNAGVTLPAKGLCLEKTIYAGDKEERRLM